MLPSGVVKGGTALKLRYGEQRTRFTPDLDVSRPSPVTIREYVDALADRLAAGWEGFTGAIAEMTVPEPPDVPDDYVMRPYRIGVAYRGRHWRSVVFELGRDEVGSTEQPDFEMPDDAVAIFAALGLPEPSPIPVMPLAHQIAQKLHACTSVNPKTGRNDRAHDLVDLQLAVEDGSLDYATTRAIAERLFVSRRAQTWPPAVVAYAGWDGIYAAAAEGPARCPRRSGGRPPTR